MAFGSCAKWNAFFSVPHTSLKKCLLVFSVVRSLILFLLFFALSSNSDIHVCPRMSVTNCSPTLWQWFFSFPCLFMTSFFPFFLFFLFFPSRSGAPDVKQPRYGFVLFLLLFFLSGEQKNAPFAQTFPPQLFLCTNPSFSYPVFFFPFLTHYPTLLFPSSPFIPPPNPNHPFHLVDFALSVTLLSCTLAFLPKTRLWPEFSWQKVMLFFFVCLKWWFAVKCHPLLKCCFSESVNRRTSVCVQNAQSMLKLLCCHSHCLAFVRQYVETFSVTVTVL